MYFKNEAHKTAFVRAAKKANQKDRRLMCKLYLLTADRALWRAAKRESNGGKYPLGRIRCKNFCGQRYYRYKRKKTRWI